MRLRFDFPDPSIASTARVGVVSAPMEFTRPREVFVARALVDVEPVVRAAEAASLAGAWVAGFISYEAAAAFDSALVTHALTDLPLAWFAAFDEPSRPADTDVRPDALPQPSLWRPRISDADYAHGFSTIKEAIANGDVYQANYTLRLDGQWDDDLWARYRALLWWHRPPYAACLECDDLVVLSLSPELMLRRSGTRVTTSPMKGTARRGRWPEEDRARKDALIASAKERAENVMIVDLARNDLGRVCEIGSVEVESLFEVQPYRAAWQMVSTVSGTLRSGVTLWDSLAAMFPAGSITGAPKTSTMKLIRAIEPEPRGLYCGAVGLLAPGGNAIFNVAIRTAVIERGSRRVSLGIGGGITWDSIAAAELTEARLKAAFLDPPPPFSLVETLRYDGASLVRWPRHLARLRASAAFFDIPMDDARVAEAVEAHVASWRGMARRLRVLVGQDGSPEVASRALDASPECARVALSTRPVFSEDVFLCHKTTNRDVYESRRAEYPEVFDVLLQNERGELTEFTIGNLVVSLDGQRWTPARESGLLPGIFREQLLLEGAIHERTLLATDLERATGIWLINSLREWVPVEIRK